MKLCLSALILLTFIGFSLVIDNRLEAADADVPVDITIENDGYHPDRKEAVYFSHLRHGTQSKIACNACHHEYENEKNIWEKGDAVLACNECHDMLASEGDVPKLKLAYHRNCQNCHKALARQGKNAPYNRCNACHAKNQPKK
jgi:hypothetical protein